jgi:DNA repair protein RadD
MNSLSLVDLLSALDHGSLANIIGDNKILELVQKIAQSRHDKLISRGQLILDILGGPQVILDNNHKRKYLFLSLDSKTRKWLSDQLKVSQLESFRFTSERRQVLYSLFGHSLPAEEAAAPCTAVELLKAGYDLYPHQSKVLLKARAFLNSEEPRVMLHMPTGSGKTRTAMHLICRHLNSREKGIVLWLVAGRELCEQAADEFRKAWGFLGERPLPLITAWDGRKLCNEESFKSAPGNYEQQSSFFAKTNWPLELRDGVIVASLDTLRELIDRWQPKEFSVRASKISLIVFDEAHRTTAPTYANIVESLLAEGKSGLLGLSATPGRSHFGSDSENDSKLVNTFNRQKVQLQIDGYSSPIEALIKEGYLAKLNKEKLEIAGCDLSKHELQKINHELEQGLDLPQETLKTIGLDATRNLQIVKCVEDLVSVKKHHRVIVFTASVESARIISSILNSLGVLSFCVSSETPYATRSRILNDFKTRTQRPVVICNFGVLTTGFDAPLTSAVVIARPTRSIVLLNQMAGRAIRGTKVGGNEEALLVTVVDTSIPQLVDTINQFHAFDNSWSINNN